MKRRILFLTLLLLTAFQLHAQWAVVDVEALAQAKIQITKMKEQHETLVQQKNKLDETLDLMRKVNENVTRLQTVSHIVGRQQSLTQKCSELLRHENLLRPQSLMAVSSLMETILSNNSRIIHLTQSVLKKDLKMNDYERLQMLNKVNEETVQAERQLHTVNRIINEYTKWQKAFD